MAARYGWRPGFRIALDADLAGREMERLRTDNAGRLTPADVLDRARSGNSALHEHFEWDDSVAAEQHRLGQASELIRAITVDVSRSNLEAKPIRAFVSVTEHGETRYTSTAHALSDADLRAQVLARAWRDLEAWRDRHADLVEFARIFSAIDEARQR